MRPFVLRGHERPINAVRFNYDGDLFFTASADNKVNMWEAYTGERIGSFATRAAVKTIDIDDNTKYLLTGGMDGTVQIFSAEDGKLLKWFKFNNKVRYLEYSLGDKWVLVLEESYKYDDPSKISVYALETMLKAPDWKDDKPVESSVMKPEFQFETRDKDMKRKLLTKAGWYLNNNAIFASTIDGCLMKYSLKGELLGMVQAHESNVEIKSFTFSKDYSIIATAAVNGCRVFDPETFKLLKVFKQELPMNSVSISPLFSSESNPKYHLIIAGGIPARESALTGGSAGFDIILCNIMYEKELGSIPGHFSPINSIEFFPDGRGFITGSEEGITKVFRFDDAYWDDPKFE